MGIALTAMDAVWSTSYRPASEGGRKPYSKETLIKPSLSTGRIDKVEPA
jgi:hypothetical protein